MSIIPRTFLIADTTEEEVVDVVVAPNVQPVVAHWNLETATVKQSKYVAHVGIDQAMGKHSKSGAQADGMSYPVGGGVDNRRVNISDRAAEKRLGMTGQSQ